MKIDEARDNLPAAIIAALDAGWSPPASFDVGRAASGIAAIFDGTHFEMTLLLAAMVRAADDGQCPDALIGCAVEKLALPFAQRNKTIQALPANVQPYQILAIIEGRLAELARATEATRSGLASKALESMVKQLQTVHPDLGLSFGYIGNCDLYGGTNWDDRSWGISTRLIDRETRMTVRFGGVPTFMMGRLMINAERDLADWCIKQEERFRTGGISRVG